MLRSFAYAFAGVAYVVRTQRNARIELAIATAAILLAAWLGLGATEWAVLILTIAVVLGAEWVNTSLELAVSLASPERTSAAKAAKDVSAAVVLVAALASVLIGIELFAPHIVARVLSP